MSSSMMGELVTETFDYDGGRQVTAYVPASQPEAVVFAGDGQSTVQWGGKLVSSSDEDGSVARSWPKRLVENLCSHAERPGGGR